MDKIKVGGIIENTYLAAIGVLGMRSRPGTAAAILGALGKAGINVQFIVQCLDDRGFDHVALCVERDDLAAALDVIGQAQAHVGATSVRSHSDVCIVSVFGPDFRERPAIAGTMFEALASSGINILAISTSISTVSCVIAGEHRDKASAAIKAVFDLP